MARSNQMFQGTNFQETFVVFTKGSGRP